MVDFIINKPMNIILVIFFTKYWFLKLWTIEFTLLFLFCISHLNLRGLSVSMVPHLFLTRVLQEKECKYTDSEGAVWFCYGCHHYWGQHWSLSGESHDLVVTEDHRRHHWPAEDRWGGTKNSHRIIKSVWSFDYEVCENKSVKQ